MKNAIIASLALIASFTAQADLCEAPPRTLNYVKH